MSLAIIESFRVDALRVFDSTGTGEPTNQKTMVAKASQLDRPAARLIAAVAILGMLTGCGAIVSSAPEAHVRIINATPDAPRLDLYQDSNALAFNLDFGTVTSYIRLTPGAYNITANTAGTRQVLSTAKTTFTTTGQYTVLIGNTAASLQQLTLADQSQPAPPGQTALRFINQATRTAAVDIYLIPAGQKISAVNPLVSGIAFGANTGYVNIPTGTYSLAMLLAGTITGSTTIATYTGPQVTYSAGAARTVILIDSSPVNAPGIKVITANDFDPPGTVD
ncbi:MAG: hypothetical protein JWQ49_4897 [Edaphobacter sp.]|nr:hypothetical protein [Edaphobacter sp.]